MPKGYGILIIIILELLLAACSSAPKVIGESKIDAKLPVASKTNDYSTFWDAISNFDIYSARNFNPGKEEIKFITAIDLIMNGEFNPAEKILKELRDNTKDYFIKIKSERALVDLLFFRSEWQEISDIDEEANGRYRSKDDAMLLVDAFRGVPREEYSFPDEPQEIELTFSPTGSPIIELTINGRVRHFWVDTGANYTVLSSRTAEECDLPILTHERSKAVTPSIRKVIVRPGVVDSISFGKLRIKNHPVVIVNEIDLKFKFFTKPSITTIDGIIGWKLIQNLDLVLDYKNSKAIIRKPVKKANSKRNLFWLGCPIVRMITQDGIILNFGLDTGAERTSITDNVFKKISIDKLYNTTKTIGTLGGWFYNNSSIIPDIILSLDHKDIHFKNIGTSYQLNILFGRLDGFLGSDIGKDNQIRIDWLNGEFDYLPE